MTLAGAVLLAVVAAVLLAVCGVGAHVAAPDGIGACVVAANGVVGPVAVATLATAFAAVSLLAPTSTRPLAIALARAVGWPPGDPLHGILLV